MAEAEPVMTAVPLPRHWPLRAALLLVWAAASFGVCYYARSLGFSIYGWPFNFWMAAQGGLAVFLLVVVVYAVGTERLERRDALRQAQAAACGAAAWPVTTAPHG